ncbi:hypothetical protein ACWDRL_10915 [Streptomyces albidoflavus]
MFERVDSVSRERVYAFADLSAQQDLAIGALGLAGHANIAAGTRHHARDTTRPVAPRHHAIKRTYRLKELPWSPTTGHFTLKPAAAYGVGAGPGGLEVISFGESAVADEGAGDAGEG